MNCVRWQACQMCTCHVWRGEPTDLATLTPQQGQAPARCARWRVRDVAAHVIGYDDLDTHGLFPLAVRGRCRSTCTEIESFRTVMAAKPAAW
jgi:Mycothiol maleylpyruvate isomerase N-terminal domain